MFNKNKNVCCDSIIKERTKFFEENPLKNLHVNDKKWRYLVAGHGKNTIVFIPGIMGKKDVFIKYLTTLSESYKILSFDYPEDVSLWEFVNGIIKIINYEMIDDVILFGQDFGGIVGQMVLREIPEKILSLILFNSSTATENIPKVNIKRNQRNLNSILLRMKGPGFLSYKKKLMKNMEKGIEISGIKNPEDWGIYYESILNSTTKEEMVSSYKMALEFWKKIKFSQLDFEKYSGEVLIIESEVDKFSYLEEISELKVLFKNHSVFIVKGSRNMAIERNRHEIIGKLIPYINGINLRKK